MDETTQNAPVQETPPQPKKSERKEKLLRDDRAFVDARFRQLTKGYNGRVRAQICAVVNSSLDKLEANIRLLLRRRRRHKFAAVKLSLDILKRAVALTFANTPGVMRSLLSHMTLAATAATSVRILPMERVRQIAGCGRTTMMVKATPNAIQAIARELVTDIKDTIEAGKKECGHAHVRSIMQYLQMDSEARVYSRNVQSLNEPSKVTRMQWHAMMY
jgi:hypothetical protein